MTRHDWGKWLLLISLTSLLGLLALAAFVINSELHTSERQARYLSELAHDLTFKLESGPSPTIRFPQSGPYDERLGYTKTFVIGAGLGETDRWAGSRFELERQVMSQFR